MLFNGKWCSIDQGIITRNQILEILAMMIRYHSNGVNDINLVCALTETFLSRYYAPLLLCHSNALMSTVVC